MKQILEDHHNKFERGAKLVWSKRDSWNRLADRLSRLFDQVKKDGEEIGLFENLYIEDSRTRKSTEHMLRFMILSWGSHPTGTSMLDDNNRLSIEGGGALTFSQSIYGDVICVMYPFKSDQHKRNEEYLILSSHHHPEWYTATKIEGFIKYFLSYSQFSSFIGSPDYMDKYRIRKLLLYDKLRKVSMPKVIFSLIKTMLGIVRKIHTGS